MADAGSDAFGEGFLMLLFWLIAMGFIFGGLFLMVQFVKWAWSVTL